MRRTKFAFLALVCLLMAGSTFGRQLPNIDKFGETAPSPAKAQLVQQRAARLQQRGSTLSTESRLGVPTFFWPNKAAVAAEIPGLKPGPTTVGGAEGAARAYLGAVASLYNLDQGDVSAAPLRYIHDIGQG